MGTLTDFNLSGLRRKYGYQSLVETGTGKGNGVAYAVKSGFRDIHSVEIDQALAEQSRSRFTSYPSVRIIQGASDTALRSILPKIQGTAIFWLDAHFPGSDYKGAARDAEANADIRVPLEREIEHVTSVRNIAGDIFLMDDLCLYENGPFEWGDMASTVGEKALPPNRNLNFVKSLLGPTHSIHRVYMKTGYVIAIPKPFDLNPWKCLNWYPRTRYALSTVKRAMMGTL